MLLDDLSEALVAAVVWIDVQDDEAARLARPDGDVGRWPA
jgi:hypothetical protein